MAAVATSSAGSQKSSPAAAMPENPLVVVTGGAGGLGREIAAQFIAGGARVHICDVDAARLAELAAQYDSSRLKYSCVDVADPSATQRLFDEVGAWDTAVSVLVNNVGIAGVRAPVEALTDEAWLESLQANFLGAARCVRHFADGMKRARAGLIVNISTVSVRTLPPSRAPYVVSKAALESLSLMLARELGPFGVRSNVIRPGGMDNERLRRVLERVAQSEGLDADTVLSRSLDHVWMKTLVSMHDVAAMVLYLASDAARHVTGQIIEVDGGTDWEN